MFSRAATPLAGPLAAPTAAPLRALARSATGASSTASAGFFMPHGPAPAPLSSSATSVARPLSSSGPLVASSMAAGGGSAATCSPAMHVSPFLVGAGPSRSVSYVKPGLSKKKKQTTAVSVAAISAATPAPDSPAAAAAVAADPFLSAVVSGSRDRARARASCSPDAIPSADDHDGADATYRGVPFADIPVSALPYLTFTRLGVAPHIWPRLHEAGYRHPTAIQLAALPHLLPRRAYTRDFAAPPSLAAATGAAETAASDVILQDMTGSGKTLAYLIPVLQSIDTAVAATQAIIVCPTRELCVQTHRAAEALAVASARKGAAVRVERIGGSIAKVLSKNSCFGQASTIPHVIVTTPRHLSALLTTASVDRSGSLSTFDSLAGGARPPHSTEAGGRPGDGRGGAGRRLLATRAVRRAAARAGGGDVGGDEEGAHRLRVLHSASSDTGSTNSNGGGSGRGKRGGKGGDDAVGIDVSADDAARAEFVLTGDDAEAYSAARSPEAKAAVLRRARAEADARAEARARARRAKAEALAAAGTGMTDFDEQDRVVVVKGASARRAEVDEDEDDDEVMSDFDEDDNLDSDIGAAADGGLGWLKHGETAIDPLAAGGAGARFLSTYDLSTYTDERAAIRRHLALRPVERSPDGTTVTRFDCSQVRTLVIDEADYALHRRHWRHTRVALLFAQEVRRLQLQRGLASLPKPTPQWPYVATPLKSVWVAAAATPLLLRVGAQALHTPVVVTARAVSAEVGAQESNYAGAAVPLLPSSSSEEMSSSVDDDVSAVPDDSTGYLVPSAAVSGWGATTPAPLRSRLQTIISAQRTRLLPSSLRHLLLTVTLPAHLLRARSSIPLQTASAWLESSPALAAALAATSGPVAGCLPSGTPLPPLPEGAGKSFEAFRELISHEATLVRRLFAALEPRTMLVFVDSHASVAPLAVAISAGGLPAACLSQGSHGRQRRAVLAALRAGRAKVVVTTNVLARGIDTADVACVVNLGAPAEPWSYVHRAGRADRMGAGARGGVVVTVVHEAPGQAKRGGEGVRPYHQVVGMLAEERAAELAAVSSDVATAREFEAAEEAEAAEIDAAEVETVGGFADAEEEAEAEAIEDELRRLDSEEQDEEDSPSVLSRLLPTLPAPTRTLLRSLRAVAAVDIHPSVLVGGLVMDLETGAVVKARTPGAGLSAKAKARASAKAKAKGKGTEKEDQDEEETHDDGTETIDYAALTPLTPGTTTLRGWQSDQPFSPDGTPYQHTRSSSLSAAPAAALVSAGPATLSAAVSDAQERLAAAAKQRSTQAPWLDGASPLLQALETVAVAPSSSAIEAAAEAAEREEAAAELDEAAADAAYLSASRYTPEERAAWLLRRAEIKRAAKLERHRRRDTLAADQEAKRAAEAERQRARARAQKERSKAVAGVREDRARAAKQERTEAWSEANAERKARVQARADNASSSGKKQRWRDTGKTHASLYDSVTDFFEGAGPVSALDDVPRAPKSRGGARNAGSRPRPTDRDVERSWFSKR